jgi:peroxiredoxin
VGTDAPEANQKWAEREGFGFEVWTDTDHVLGTTYGAWTGEGRYARLTRLIGPDGKLLLEYDVGLGIGTHPQDVLDDCKKLKAEGKLR